MYSIIPFGVWYNGFYAPVDNFPISSNSFIIANNYLYGDYGLISVGGGITFATGADPATPVNFALNQLIDSRSGYSIDTPSLFKSTSSVSPDFGPGSYMGFQTSQGNYGWLEVTWTASSEEFQILSGAYESVADTPIVTPAAAPIPEPGTWAAMAIFAGGAAFAGWRRRKSAKIAA